jgi:hypothetical protein
MKNISLNYLIKPFQTGMLALLCLICFYACKKDDAVRFSTDLALNTKVIKIADTAGSTHVLVYADEEWTVRPDPAASWLTIDRQSGNGKGEFVATVESNVGNLPRGANIVVTAAGKTDTINLQQRGIVPAINILDATAKGIAGGGLMKTAIATNVPFELMQHAEVYSVGGTNWISGLAINGTNLNFSLAQNPSTEAREALIRLTYKDALGTTVKDSIVVTQNPKGAYDQALLKDFNYVKTALAAGIITEDIYIEGVIISDKGNPNMGLNANSAANKHVVDKTENGLTSYIQSLDGKSGFRIRSKTGGDNIYGRNEVVKIWLKGVMLKKDVNPSRVTLDQVQSINVISKVPAASAVVPREIYMKDLTDEDVYTYVKLKQVEISVPNGSFFNINEGYILRTDAYPMNIRDIDGNSMYMLTNIDVLYRRDGIRVPQGSGNISGILVNEVLPRYGNNIGKYSIRHITREDIDLKENREDGFSNILVEWSRFKTENSAGATALKNPMTPDIGTGTLTQSQKTALDFSANGIYAGPDYNGLLIESATVKGVISNGGWASKTWWNDAKNIGASWNINVSTSGIAKPISLQIEGASDMGGPTNFIVEWSSTGTDAGTWNQVGEYTFQDIVIYANTLLTQVPGHKVVNFPFPIQASGLENLYIRLRVKNKTVGTATAPTGGTLAAAGVSRLGHLSIKYNK